MVEKEEADTRFGIGISDKAGGSARQTNRKESRYASSAPDLDARRAECYKSGFCRNVVPDPIRPKLLDLEGIPQEQEVALGEHRTIRVVAHEKLYVLLYAARPGYCDLFYPINHLPELMETGTTKLPPNGFKLDEPGATSSSETIVALGFTDQVAAFTAAKTLCKSHDPTDLNKIDPSVNRAELSYKIVSAPARTH